MKQKRLDILSSVFPDFIYQDVKDEFITWCPNRNPGGCNGGHHKRKLQINIEKNVFDCWVCGYSGFITRLIHDHFPAELKAKYINTLPDFENRAEVDEVRPALSLPEGSRFLLDSLDDPKAVRSLEWLRRETGAPDESIYFNKVMFCPFGRHAGRILFPSFDDMGNLNFYQTRDVDIVGRYKYINSETKIRDVVFNEILINWSKPIILVESIKSVIAHFRIPNVIPILGTKFSKRFRIFRESIFNNTPLVYVFLDPKERSRSYDIMNIYNSFGVETRLIQSKTSKQPDNLRTDEFIESLENYDTFSRKMYLQSRIEKIRDNL